MTHVVLILCIIAFIAFTEFRLKEDVTHIHQELNNLNKAIDSQRKKWDILDSRIDDMIIKLSSNGESVQQ